MVKKLLIILFSTLPFFSSCSKSEGTDPSQDLSIREVRTGADRILYKINEDIYIGGHYIKTYEKKDNLTMTLNGVRGELVRETYAYMSGCRSLFRFPAVQSTGDYKIEFTVKAGKTIKKATAPLRVISSYSISNVWQALQKDYLMQVSLLTLRKVNNEIEPGPYAYREPDLSLGMYFLQSYPNVINGPMEKAFIPGVSGIYSVDFRNGILQQIRILHGNQSDERYYTPRVTYDQIEKVYGKSASGAEYGFNGKTTRYVTGGFTIAVNERYEITSTITKNP
ncbi:MAG: hypothetical protein INR69_12600 [Mucilaginibacter polytrichastri]|nr:hypothetical protein [Mucilaginibacter polytrichastri]